MTDESKTPGIVLVSGGKTYTLARPGLARTFNEQRDALYNDMAVYEEVGLKEIKHCAYLMLTANHKLSPEDAIVVLDGFDKNELVDAVLDAILVHRCAQQEQGYTSWARSSLIANGIEPSKVAHADLPHVLRQLVWSRRAMPLDEFTPAGNHVALKAELMAVD